MGQRTLRKNVFREIRSTLNRFLAIFAITVLGAGFFAGLRATAPSMQATADAYFADQNLMDMRLLSTMGFTENDLAALEALDEVETVMPTYAIDLLAEAADGVDAVRLHALPDDRSAGNQAYLSRIILNEGRYPEAANEAIADSQSHYKIGDIIKLSPQNDEDSLDLMAETEFTVVGIADSSYYISFTRGNTSIGNGSLSTFVYLDASAFDSEYYLEVQIKLAGAAGLSSQSAEYAALVDAAQDALEAFGEERAQIRYDEILDEANEEIADAEQEIADAKQELADGWQELDDAKQELADGKAEADAELAKAWAKIQDGQREIADGKRELEDNRAQLANAEREIADGEAAIANNRPALEDGTAQYNAGLAEYNTQKAEFDAGYAEFEALKAEFEAGAAGVEELSQAAAGLAQLAEGMNALAPAAYADEAAAGQFAALAGQGAEGLEAVAAQLSAAGETEQAAGLQQAAEGVRSAAQYGLYTEAAGAMAEASGGLSGAVAVMQAEMDAGAAELAAYEAQLEEGRRQLDEGWQTLQESKAQLDAGWAELESGEAELAAARQTVNSGWVQLGEGEQALREAEQELADGIAEYNSEKAKAEQEIADAEVEIADGEAELLDGERELAEAEEELADAKQELADLEAPTWYVFDRSANPGYEGLASNTDRIGAIATALPYFFFLVTALVCLTTMTRMVEEQRTQIGTFKALGFSKFSIAVKYLLYAGLASLFGGLVGVAIGYYLFPSVIWNAYRMMYIMPGITYSIDVFLILQSVLALMLVTMGVTLFSCLSSLRSVPAELMRPKAPKNGTRVLLERIPFIWNRFKFSWKVTARNLFRYKNRFFMTVIGVAGCTALLVTGFGLYDSITGIAEQQYTNVSHYDMIVQLTDPADGGEASEVNERLDELGRYAYVYETTIDAETARANNRGYTTYLSVMENPESFGDFVSFQDRKSGNAVAFPQGDGVVVTEKLATHMNLSVGDTVTISPDADTSVEVTVAGISENYVYHYIYMTPDTYEALFGEAPEFNRVYLDIDADSGYTESAALSYIVNAGNVAGAVGMTELKSEMDDMLDSLNSVVYIIIICAALLAFVVLYNLTNINITERQREIATLKVLGFYNGEVAGYVYRENVILTLIGIVAGLFLGIFLHRYIILTAEVDEVMFGRAIKAMSFVLSGVFTLLCGAFVNLVMLKKLKKIDMVESLKSAE